MSDISSVSNMPQPQVDSSSKAKRRSNRMLRRRRSSLSTINQHLDRILRTRNVFRAGAVLLPLAGFLLVSHNNGVFASDDSKFGAVTSEVDLVNNDGSTASVPGTLADTSLALERSDDRSAGELADVRAPASFSMVQLAYNGSVTDLISSGLSFTGAAEATTGSTRDKATTTTITTTAQSENKSNTYVVNEGGSLWRTGRRFIDDEVLLDKLIDNLSESGMNVRSVRPGVEFIVNDLGSKGMLVVVEQDGDTYESHIVRNNVTLSVRRQATGSKLPRTASHAQ